jgi:hypothetical protein
METTVHLRTYYLGLTSGIEDMHQYCSKDRNITICIWWREPVALSGGCRRPRLTGRGRLRWWREPDRAVALVEEAEPDGGIGGWSRTEW